MADITITINDTNIADVRDRLCTRWSYSGTGTNADKVAFLKARLARFVKDEYKLQKIDEAFQGSVETVRIDAGNTAETVEID